MLKNHFCEFEVAEDLIFCITCGKQPKWLFKFFIKFIWAFTSNDMSLTG